MLGAKQDLFGGRSVSRKAESGETFDAMLCPACTRPMTHVRTIWRAFQDDLQVFECRACNLSVSVKVPPEPE